MGSLDGCAEPARPEGLGRLRVEPWLRILALSIGGALGVNARYWLGVWISRWVSHQFPWATFSINVSGSFAIGFLATLLARWVPHPHARFLVVVGFLGGYTTFSSFSIEALTLWENGARVRSAAYVLGSVAAGLTAVVLGTALGREVVVRYDRPVSAAAESPLPALTESGSPPRATGRPATPAHLETTPMGLAARTDGILGTTIPARAQLLRIYVNSSAYWEGRHLYQVIVEEARAQGVAGASVFPLTFSFGSERSLRDAASDYEFADIPVVIEIIDAPGSVETLLARIRPMTAESLLTVSPVQIVREAIAAGRA